jgi:hypothetical protein
MLTRSNAHDVAQRAQAPIGADFHTLTSSQVERLLVEADRLKYRKRKNAPGSRGRMFWQYIQRRAQ